MSKTNNEEVSVGGVGNKPRLQGNMGVAELTMSVLAFSAPLMTVTGMLPVLLMYSGYKSVPIYLYSTLILLLFSVGFVQMGLRMLRPGGFYAFITDGLGRSAGLGAAFLAMVMYPIVGFVGPPYFALVLKGYVEGYGGPVIPWYVYGFLYVLLIGALAFRKIDLSAKILTLVMILESLIVVVFDYVSFVHGGPSTEGGVGFGWPGLTDKGFGIGLLFVVGTFLGFEATVIYRDEVRNPLRTIPLATYYAIVGIGIFYAIGTWAFITYYGASNVQAAATANTTGLFVSIMQHFFGKVIIDIVTILIMTSMAASTLSVWNVSARYLHSLGTDGVLPAFLGKVHPRHHSPYVGTTIIGIVYGAGVIFFGAIQFDPTKLYALASGVGSFGVMLLLFAASIAIVVYFKKNKFESVSVWSTFVAPVLSVIGIGFSIYLALAKYGDLLGASGAITIIFILITFAIPVVGFFYAQRLRVKKPDVYQRIGRQEP
ncbi:amino acid permease [Paenibacillus durus ATCC 35681]|uniref:Amino acid permease n=1 Tax=Paenibacillus durus ATCC 35681 TaxID=1333534 RepID=A0A0F7FFS2_PAEDU|nr:amino acid permease [Paenibacillus durus ATCC 35681]